MRQYPVYLLFCSSQQVPSWLARCVEFVNLVPSTIVEIAADVKYKLVLRQSLLSLPVFTNALKLSFHFGVNTASHINVSMFCVQILVIPLPSAESHTFVMVKIVEELVARGNEILVSSAVQEYEHCGTITVLQLPL